MRGKDEDGWMAEEMKREREREREDQQEEEKEHPIASNQILFLFELIHLGGSG